MNFGRLVRALHNFMSAYDIRNEKLRIRYVYGDNFAFDSTQTNNIFNVFFR